MRTLDAPAPGGETLAPFQWLLHAVITEAIADYLVWHYQLAGIKIPRGVRKTYYPDYCTADGFLFLKEEPYETFCELLDIDHEALARKVKDLVNTPTEGIYYIERLRRARKEMEEDNDQE